MAAGSGAVREERIAHSRALEFLDRVGLADFAAKYADELSYGQQRRLELARALAASPRLLLLDEPTSGLPGEEIDRLTRLLRNSPRAYHRAPDRAQYAVRR